MTFHAGPVDHVVHYTTVRYILHVLNPASGVGLPGHSEIPNFTIPIPNRTSTAITEIRNIVVSSDTTYPQRETVGL